MIIPGIFMTFGQLVSWVLGYFISWRLSAYALMAPPLLLTLLFIPFPETAYWLVENNQLNLAKKSLEFYRGNQYNVAEELFEISQKHEAKLRNAVSLTLSTFPEGFHRGNQNNMEDNEKNDSKLRRNTPNTKAWMHTAKKILSMTFFRPFSCVGLIYIIFTWTGHFTFQVYMIIILREIASSIDPSSASKIDSNITPVIIGIVGVVTASMPYFII